MKSRGKYLGAHISLEGDLIVELSLEDIATEDLESLKDEDLSIELKKYKARRSLSANGYLWSLCDQIGKKIGNSKDTIYQMLLRDYGVFESYTLPVEATEALKFAFKIVDCIDEWEMWDADRETLYTMREVHCYRGSHDYDTLEFSKLLEGAIRTAQDIGIDTWNEEETKALLERWELDHRREKQ